MTSGDVSTDGGVVDDLAGTLTELGRTDFVRKYSRKTRPAQRPYNSTSTHHTCTDLTCTDHVRSAASSSPRYQHSTTTSSSSSPLVPGCEDNGQVETDHIPSQRDDVQHLADQCRPPETTVSDEGGPTSSTAARAGAGGLGRSESESSKVRSFTLRSLRSSTMPAVRHSPTMPPPAPRGHTDSACTAVSCETDDEGVGEGEIDEPSYKDAYVSVTAAGRELDRHQFRRLPTSISTRGRQLTFTDHAGMTSSSPKTNSGARFQTHPPLRERGALHEPGSVDSNGLRALRDVTDTNKQMLTSQVSFSSADSHICRSEDSSSLSVQLGADMDQLLVRKNSKTQKHKSKSDPTRGDKIADGSVVDIPSIISGTMHAHSSPVLVADDNDHPPTQFPFSTDSPSTSDVSEREVTEGRQGRPADDYCQHDDVAAVRGGVVLKSDDSFDDQLLAVTTSVKPPRPKKRPRATTVTDTATATNLVRKVFWKDRNGSRLHATNGGSQTDLSTTPSNSSSLTLPLSKKTALLRSHSSAGKHAESLVICRQRSPGAPDSTSDVQRAAARTGVVTSSASVPELCDATTKDHISTSYTPSLEPVLSSSTCSIYDSPSAGDKV